MFQGVQSCDLVDIFKDPSQPPKPRYTRRGSSGNWIQDRLTWKEEMEYKRAMGYYKQQQAQPAAPPPGHKE